jgi:aspartate/glutamate racemase
LGLACTLLGEEDQSLINQLIETIKVSGSVQSPTLQTATRHLFEQLRTAHVDTVIAGCTELSVLAEIATEAGLRLIDSNTALAHAALRRLNLPTQVFQPE